MSQSTTLPLRFWSRLPLWQQIERTMLSEIGASIYAPGSRGTYAYETLLNHLDAQERQRRQEVKP